jgi:hypothetical protein
VHPCALIQRFEFGITDEDAGTLQNASLLAGMQSADAAIPITAALVASGAAAPFYCLFSPAAQ